MLTTQQAAKLLGYKDKGSIRQLILKGSIQATKQGRDWMIDPAEVQRFRLVRQQKRMGKQ